MAEPKRQSCLKTGQRSVKPTRFPTRNLPCEGTQIPRGARGKTFLARLIRTPVPLLLESKYMTDRSVVLSLRVTRSVIFLADFLKTHLHIFKLVSSAALGGV